MTQGKVIIILKKVTMTREKVSIIPKKVTIARRNVSPMGLFNKLCQLELLLVNTFFKDNS